MTERDYSRFASRATVDLDAKPGTNVRLEATRIYHNLQEVADMVEVHVSSSQEGLHFVAWFEEDLPFHEQVAIRRAHQDDKKRLNMDIQRWQSGLWTDILFSTKSDRDGEKERRFRDVYDALDYIDAGRDDHERMKRLANDGHKGAPDLARRLS